MQLISSETNALMDVLKKTAPGTALREGLDNVLRANTGGLIVIGDSAKIKPLTKGGFDIDTDYSPAHLYELAKMDGAILISPDVKRIISANTHLMPDPDVPSSETGIRHRTAEQTARQTGALVICISQRRRVITLYKGTSKYVLKDVSVLLNTANQALGTLEKYKDVLEEAVLRLSVQEFDNVVTLPDVLTVVQRAELFKRVEQMLRLYLTELGDESTLIRMQAEELSSNVEAEERLTIRDYMIRDPEKTGKEQVDDYLERLARLSGPAGLEPGHGRHRRCLRRAAPDWRPVGHAVDHLLPLPRHGRLCGGAARDHLPEGRRGLLLEEPRGARSSRPERPA